MGVDCVVRIGWDFIKFIDPDKEEGEDELLFISGETAYEYIVKGIKEGKLKISNVGVVVMNEE